MPLRLRRVVRPGLHAAKQLAAKLLEVLDEFGAENVRGILELLDRGMGNLYDGHLVVDTRILMAQLGA